MNTYLYNFYKINIVLIIVFSFISIDCSKKKVTKNLFGKGKSKEGYIELTTNPRDISIPINNNNDDNDEKYDSSNDDILKSITNILDIWINEESISKNKNYNINRCIKEINGELNKITLKTFEVINPLIIYYEDLKAKESLCCENTIEKIVLKEKLKILFDVIDNFTPKTIYDTLRKAIRKDDTSKFEDLKNVIELSKKKELLIYSFTKKKFAFFKCIFKNCKDEGFYKADLIKILIQTMINYELLDYSLIKYLNSNYRDELCNYNYQNETFLHLALKQDEFEIFKNIVKLDICDFGQVNDKGENIFHIAAKLKMIKKFIAMMNMKEAKLEHFYAKSSDDEKTPIYYIFENWKKDKDHLRIVIKLLKNFGFDVNSNISTNNPFIFGLTTTNNYALFKHIYNTYKPIINNIKNSHGNTVWSILIKGNKSKIIKYFEEQIEKEWKQKQEDDDEKYDDIIDLQSKNNYRFLNLLQEEDTEFNSNFFLYNNNKEAKNTFEYLPVNFYFQNHPILLELVEKWDFLKKNKISSQKYVTKLFFKILRLLDTKYAELDLKLESKIEKNTILHHLAKSTLGDRELYRIARMIIKNSNIYNRFKEIDLHKLNIDNKTCMEIAIEKQNFVMVQLFKFLGYDLLRSNPITGYNVIHQLECNIPSKPTLSIVYIIFRIKFGSPKYRKYLYLKKKWFKILYFFLDRHKMYELLERRSNHDGVYDNKSKLPLDLYLEGCDKKNKSIINLLDPDKNISLKNAIYMLKYRICRRKYNFIESYKDEMTDFDKFIEIIAIFKCIIVILFLFLPFVILKISI